MAANRSLLLLRVISYPTAIALFLWLLGGDDLKTDSVALSAFTLFLVGTEMLLDHQLQRGLRFVFYCLCVLGVYLSGVSLLSQAVECKACQSAEVRAK